MIPKIIHYAWFGSPMPNKIRRRVNEWKNVLTDWKFMEWNEQNFDLSEYKFSYQKFVQKDYGYVTDELRFAVLYKYGGFYLDTDMIINKNLDPFLKDKRVVLGFMYDDMLLTSLLGAEAGEPLLMDVLKYYKNEENLKVLNENTNNPIFTNILKNKFKDEFSLDNKKQELGNGIFVYPRDYFCYPSKNQSANYAEHLFDNAWNNNKMQKGIYGLSKRLLRKMFPVLMGNLANKRHTKTSNKGAIS